MKEARPDPMLRLLGTLFLILVVVISILASVLIIDQRHVKFIFNGPELIRVEAGESFTDPGVKIVTNGRIFKEGGENFEYKTVGDIDTSKTGMYTLTYKANYLFHTYTASRRVEVVDTIAPELFVEQSEGYSPSWLTGYEEEGVTAYDKHDGDLTDKIERTEGDGFIIYTVTDSSGNKTTAVRELPAMKLPVLTLAGGESISLTASSLFSEPGYMATDGLGNDISSCVKIDGEVIPYVPGEYELVYYLQNTAGETVSATRHISILPGNKHDEIIPSSKTIYLTFDDGPGPYTSQLLDVLSQYGVKATFFVTNGNPKYQSLIGRAASEGHAIGVHTYSHDYKSIYSSEEAFLEDFNAMQEIIYAQTGSYTKLFRFPGGSSNTVSSFNPGIMSRLTVMMENMGYVYFDWNVASGDAGETTKTDVVYDNVVDGCSGKRAAIVLQHDIKDFSVAAVKNIIRWGINNGYSFAALDEDSYKAHHGVNN